MMAIKVSIGMTLDAKHIFNNDEFFADMVDTQEEGVEQHRNKNS